MTEELSKKGTVEELSQIENTVIDLRSKVSGELTGGRSNPHLVSSLIS
jgi:hypothetical protein